MNRRKISRPFWAITLALFLPLLVTGGDIVHKDDKSPRIPGCSNDFVLVNVQTWINNIEDSEFVGVSDRFGKQMQSKEKYANRNRLSLADPSDCCTAPKTKVNGDVLLVHWGGCKFTTKAKVAEAAGPFAMLIINYYKVTPAGP